MSPKRPVPTGSPADGPWWTRPDPTGETDTGEFGLRFECTQCGNCCTGPSGYVQYTDDEANAMARDLGITREAFDARYTRDTIFGPSLTETETEFGEVLG